MFLGYYGTDIGYSKMVADKMKAQGLKIVFQLKVAPTFSHGQAPFVLR